MNCPAGMIFVAIQFMERSEKSWRSQFMMRRHQFICKNEQSKNRRNFPFTLALFVVIRAWDSPILYLTSQMRCSHLAVFSNSPLRTSPIRLGYFFACYPLSVVERGKENLRKLLTSARKYDTISFTNRTQRGRVKCVF